MTQAKQRNPNIKLYGLPWTFPAWVGNGTGNPYAFPQLTADYIVKWVDGAKTVYGLDIDYVVCLAGFFLHAGFRFCQYIYSESWVDKGRSLLTYTFFLP
jgi:hypothetical protein